jgi:hypothetical protein
MACDEEISLDEMISELNHWKMEIATMKSLAARSSTENLKYLCEKIGRLQKIIESMKKKAVILRWQHVKQLNNLGNQLENAVNDLNDILLYTATKFDNAAAVQEQYSNQGELVYKDRSAS